MSGEPSKPICAREVEGRRAKRRRPSFLQRFIGRSRLSHSRSASVMPSEIDRRVSAQRTRTAVTTVVRAVGLHVELAVLLGKLEAASGD